MDDLHRAARTLALLARVLERAAGDLTLPQYRVLALVAAGDERATRLAGRLAITKPSVSAVVDGLVERGFLAREPVKADRPPIPLDRLAGQEAPLDQTVHDRADARFGDREPAGEPRRPLVAGCDQGQHPVLRKGQIPRGPLEHPGQQREGSGRPEQVIHVVRIPNGVGPELSDFRALGWRRPSGGPPRLMQTLRSP